MLAEVPAQELVCDSPKHLGIDAVFVPHDPDC